MIDIVRELAAYGCRVHVHDPLGDPEEARAEYGVELVAWEELPRAAAIVVAVAHRQYRAMAIDDIAARLPQ